MKLSNQQKLFIVECLARWHTPTEVVELVAEEWPGTRGKLDRRQVGQYSPRAANCGISQDLRDHFDETREAFKKATTGIGIAHQAFRLRELESLYRRAERAGNLVLAAQLLEQAAKECGLMYTNARRLDLAADVQVSGVLRVPEKSEPEQWAKDAAAYYQKVREYRTSREAA